MNKNIKYNATDKKEGVNPPLVIPISSVKGFMDDNKCDNEYSSSSQEC